MQTPKSDARERIGLIATNSMRIAGIQSVYGDPCGMEIIPVPITEALNCNLDGVLLIDAGSVNPLFELLGKLHESCPRKRMIVLGRDGDETYIECVIHSGARGFLGANACAEEFQSAVENVREGSIWATRRVLSRLIECQMSLRPSPESSPKPLFTPRERQIVRLLVNGKANREIGDCLGIDHVTVKAHLGRIMRKAGVANRVELTIFALNRGSGEKAVGIPGGFVLRT